MREGTTKLLAACGSGQASSGRTTNLPHTLEAAKNLLTSNERMTAYMAELQRRRAAPTAVPHGCVFVLGCLGGCLSVCLFVLGCLDVCLY